MAQSSYSDMNEQQAEIARLESELAIRDQLVQQLSQELFRLVKGNAGFVPSPEVSEQHQAEMSALRDQLRGVEKQIDFYQGQLEERDSEVLQLRQTVQELTDRTRMLEQVVQELPTVYRQKFADRMAAVKQRVAEIQRENRQLQAELQSVSYRLAMRTRRSQRLELPTLEQEGLDGISLPSF
ncbi:Npun_F5560 family protein [Nodosilinea sp. LEGE 07298]|uniref:Npun_F5560 family protein n=1 Tax=Nodosilinea sp. LEGE 07298 TaxID=2777970 RepID=UPI0028BE3F5A|nr:Npun_F5560 family protein [Nodosilinea sp. LEGE 07298]